MLTDKRLKSLKPASSEYIVADGQGLSVRVWPSGEKTFQYRYRVNRKLERLTIGTYPKISLKEARERRDDARKLVKQGISPAYTKQVAKGMAAAAALRRLESLRASSWSALSKRNANALIMCSRCSMPISSRGLAKLR